MTQNSSYWIILVLVAIIPAVVLRNRLLKAVTTAGIIVNKVVNNTQVATIIHSICGIESEILPAAATTENLNLLDLISC